MAFPPVSYNERGILAFQKCPRSLITEARREWPRRPGGGLSSGSSGEEKTDTVEEKATLGATAAAAGTVKGTEVRVFFFLNEPGGGAHGIAEGGRSLAGVCSVCVCWKGDHISLKPDLCT